jgi:hypothetical protein
MMGRIKAQGRGIKLLYYSQGLFFTLKGTPSQEESKTGFRVFTTFESTLPGQIGIIWQLCHHRNYSRYHWLYRTQHSLLLCSAEKVLTFHRKIQLCSRTIDLSTVLVFSIQALYGTRRHCTEWLRYWAWGPQGRYTGTKWQNWLRKPISK